MLYNVSECSPQFRSMLNVMQDYVDARGYILAAKFGIDESNVHCYYVKHTCPDCKAIVNDIHSTRYIWPFSKDSAGKNYVVDL